MIEQNTPRRPRHTSRGGIEYRVIYALGFAFFLIAAMVCRTASTVTWRARRDTRSILQEAREAAGATTSYAFHG